MKRAFEIIFDDEFDRFVKACQAASSWPMTRTELLKRWISFGLARDMGRPEHEAASVLNNLTRIYEK